MSNYSKGVSAAVIATMNALGDKPMDEVVAKIMANVKLPVHRARAYYRTFVNKKLAKGAIPVKVKAVKAPKAKEPAKETKVAAQTVPSNDADERKARLIAAAKKAGVQKDKVAA